MCIFFKFVRVCLCLQYTLRLYWNISQLSTVHVCGSSQVVNLDVSRCCFDVVAFEPCAMMGMGGGAGFNGHDAAKNK